MSARTDTERLDAILLRRWLSMPTVLEYWKKVENEDGTTTHVCEVAIICTPTTVEEARAAIDTALDYHESGAGNHADRVPLLGAWIGK